jgi:hypothetical protein
MADLAPLEFEISKNGACRLDQAPPAGAAADT